MNSTWQNYLIEAGATFSLDGELHFSALQNELAAAQNSTILTDLSDFALIAASGVDAGSFLQGQFTNDINKISHERAQYSGYCSPKGRLLANFLVWQTGSDYFLQIPAEVAPSVQKRLSMFVLRAKVLLQDKSDDYVRLGVAGSNAEAAACDIFPGGLAEDLAVRSKDELTLIRLAPQRFEVIAPVQAAPGIWQKLAAHAQPVGQHVWSWLNIQAGLPIIRTATQDQFVPQMVNFELIGGVDFKKGCYTGQEIVARTQYLGKLKRRLYLADLQSNDAPAAGDALYSADLGEQASGMIVNAALSPSGSYSLLASIQIASAATQTIHWQSLTGPTLAIRNLPYPV